MKKLTSLFCAVALTMGATAYAENFPNREVEVVVNYGAGGVTDVATRLLGRSLSKQLGQPVVVTNKPGGQATIGPAYLARQKPDGYTTGIITFSAVAITPHMLEVPYTVEDFDFLGGFGRYRYGLAVNADSPYKSVKDLVEAAKKSEKPIFFGVPGAPNNVAFFELGRKTGGKFEQILYKSGAESVAAVASNQVAATIQTPSEIRPLVESGKVRLLASVSPDRWSDAPDMPTMKEEGYDVQIESWLGLAAPKGLPADVRDRLEKALSDAMKDQELVDGLNNMGIDPVWISGKAYAERLAQGYKDMRPLLELTGQPLIEQK